MTRFTELLISFNDHFYMDNSISEISFCPVLIFKSKLTSQIYEFDMPRMDMEDYEYGRKSKKISEMISGLTSVIREEKLNKIL